MVVYSLDDGCFYLTWKFELVFFSPCVDAGLFERYVGGGLVSGALTGIPASQPVPSGTRSLTAAFVTDDSGKLGGAGVECLDTEV